MRNHALVMMFWIAASIQVTFAAPPKIDVPSEIKATGDYVTLSPKTDAKAITYVGMSGVEPFPSQFLKDSKDFILPVRGLPEGAYKFTGVASLNDEHTTFQFTVIVGNKPIPPPIDPPNPPDPVTPTPPTTFRVIFVYESGDTLTATQSSILYGVKVSDYLEANVTKDGNRPSWRRFDKDQALTQDTVAVKELWSAVQSKITVTPCIVIQADSRVTIEPFPSSVDATVTLLKKYKEGK